MDTIFLNEAPRLWGVGLSAIPLAVSDKKPVVTAWSTYQHELPAEHVRDEWLVSFPTGNVGVVMGSQSNLCALDLDTNDPTIQGILDQVLPTSPWTRVGAKGSVRIFRHNPSVKTFRIDDEDGKRLFELLCGGTQIVVPPSIHPTTQRPYQANRDLVDLLAQEPHLIRPLPDAIEDMIRKALRDAGVKLRAKTARGAVTSWVPAGARDTTAVSTAGLFARDVVTGQRTFLEAAEQLEAWRQNFVERVWGDEISPEKCVSKLVEFLIRDVTGPRRQRLPPGWDTGLTPDDKQRLGFGILDEDAVSLTADEIIDFFNVEISRPGLIDSPDGKARLAERIAVKIAGNPKLSPIDEGRIIDFVTQACGRGFTNTALRKMVITLRRGEIIGEDHTEISKAAIAEKLQEAEIRFHEQNFWRWAGSHWERFDANEWTIFLSNNYGKYPACRRGTDFSQIIKLIGAHLQKPLETDKRVGINFVNGFLTEDLQLIPHDPDLGATYCLPYPYAPGMAAQAPKFFGMLHDMWCDDEDYREKLMLLQEAFAVTLFGVATKYQRSFCLWGVGGAGKTQILDVLTSLLPSGSVSHIPPTSWGDRFLPAEMSGKLLNVGGDLSENEPIADGIFKQIVGGEVIDVQRKHGQPFKMVPTCAQWMLTNHAPRTRDSSEGFTRRLLFLKFNKIVPESQRIADLGKMVGLEEREAIVAWAVEGYARFREQQHLYTQPISHRDAYEAVARTNNDVRAFLEAAQVQGEIVLGRPAHKGFRVTSIESSTLYRAYQSYCRTGAGVPPVRLSTFENRMESLAGIFGFEIQTVRLGEGTSCRRYNFVTIADKKAA
jgi:P4 family phage/plasmid primase-like protien